MNTDEIVGEWNDMCGRLREAWADLTDSELEHLKGGKQEAIGFLQKKYGQTKEVIEEKFNQIRNTIKAKL